MLPATTKSQREPMYRDLERFISPGFLTTTVRVGGIPIGIRSLGSVDLDFLRAYAKEKDEVWTLWAVAASIWMIDGHYLLDSYPSSMKAVYDWLRHSNKLVVRALFGTVSSFFLRYRKANSVLEPYLYEETSRRLWGATKNLHGWSLAGSYPGSERLGINPYQMVWADWNQQEDTRNADEYSWSLTKVLVSLQSNKASKKLDSRDKARSDNEKKRRSEVQDRAYYIWTGDLTPEGEPTQEEGPRRAFQPRTNEELAEEMRRWVAGEKDFHDLVVDDYINRIRAGYEAREAEKQLRLQEAAERRAREEQEAGFSRPSLVALTPDQVQEIVKKKGKTGAKFIIEADPVSRSYNRFVRDDPNPGALRVDGDRVVPYSSPVSEPARSLDDLISNRKPTF